MSPETKDILQEALQLPPEDSAALADCLLASFKTPPKAIDAAWKTEVEARLDAYRRGELSAVPVEAGLQNRV